MDFLSRKRQDSVGSFSSNSCCEEYECYCLLGDAHGDNSGVVVNIDIEDGR